MKLASALKMAKNYGGNMSELKLKTNTNATQRVDNKHFICNILT
jgi:hypothetical protein